MCGGGGEHKHFTSLTISLFLNKPCVDKNVSGEERGEERARDKEVGFSIYT